MTHCCPLHKLPLQLKGISNTLYLLDIDRHQSLQDGFTTHWPCRLFRKLPNPKSSPSSALSLSGSAAGPGLEQFHWGSGAPPAEEAKHKHTDTLILRLFIPLSVSSGAKNVKKTSWQLLLLLQSYRKLEVCLSFTSNPNIFNLLLLGTLNAKTHLQSHREHAAGWGRSI